MLDHICKNLRVALLLSIHEESRDCSFFNVISPALSVLLLVLLDGLLHLDFLFKSFFVEELSLDALQGLSFLRNYLRLSCLLLASLLLGVQPLSETLLMQLHVVVLRHSRC